MKCLQHSSKCSVEMNKIAKAQDSMQVCQLNVDVPASTENMCRCPEKIQLH